MQPVELVTLKALLQKKIWTQYGPSLYDSLFSSQITKAGDKCIKTLHEGTSEDVEFDTLCLALDQSLDQSKILIEALSGVDVPTQVHPIIARHIQNQILLDVAQEA